MQIPALLRRVLLAGGALALAAPAQAQRGGGEPIRIGAVLSVTGPASASATPRTRRSGST